MCVCLVTTTSSKSASFKIDVFTGILFMFECMYTLVILLRPVWEVSHYKYSWLYSGNLCYTFAIFKLK